MLRIAIPIALTLLLFAGTATAEDERELYFVIRHLPGAGWDHSLSYLVQPGIGAHVQYISALHEEGRVVMGGPFLDNSGGMVIMRGDSAEEVLRLAKEDPAVRGGLLDVEVRPWHAVLSSVRPVPRKPPQMAPSDQPFTIKSEPQDAPINIDDE